MVFKYYRSSKCWILIVFIKQTESVPLPMGKMDEIHARFRTNEKKSCVTTVQIIFIRGKENITNASEHLY